MTLLCTLLVAVLPTASWAQSPPAGQSLPRALVAALQRGEALMIMRHAIAPGTGDPATFTLGDCSTQRNLSDEGRAQSEAIGKRLRDAGIERARVRHSQWCRCRDTARLLGLGDALPMPVLNSFFQGRGDREAQTDGLQRVVTDELSTGASVPLMLVTHQVNITALTGVYPASGELLLLGLEQDQLQVLFRLQP